MSVVWFKTKNFGRFIDLEMPYSINFYNVLLKSFSCIGKIMYKNIYNTKNKKSFAISHPHILLIGIEVVKMCFNVGIEDNETSGEMQNAGIGE